MAITEVFLPLLLKFFALGIFFLRGFTLATDFYKLLQQHGHEFRDLNSTFG